MKKEKTYLLTYYLKNIDERTKAVFENIPYKTKEISLSEERLIKLIEAELKKYPYIRCCSVMSKEWFGQDDWALKFTVSNPFFLEEPIPHEIKPKDAEHIVINDSMNQVYMTKYEPSHEGFEVNLESEQKVIRLGSYFYDLKGVLLCEATDEDRKKYYCDKFITFPIVDDDWRVFDGKEISDGIERLIVGKKGDTIPLAALREAADYNAREHDCEYETQLVDLERHGITISNRKSKDSSEELPDNIVIGIDKLGEKRFRMDADWGSYYIPRRFFFVGEDDELYESDNDDDKPSAYHQKLLTRIVDDVWGLSWFFNKPKLRVLVTAVTDCGFGFQRSELGPIPKDWFYTVQTLEGEINRELDEMHKKYPDNYNSGKRPDIVEEKKYTMTLTYIFHSGFVLETEKSILIFDYWLDLNGVVTPFLKKNKPVYVFSSHFHEDHFNRAIFEWKKQREGITYILSKDIYKHRRANKEDADVWLAKGDTWSDGTISVWALGSTDSGVSWIVETEGKRFFHAGDLNNWYARFLPEAKPGETIYSEEFDEDIDPIAHEKQYLGELKDIRKITDSFDVVMFPIDGRIGNGYTLGGRQFIERFKVGLFVPMHFVASGFESAWRMKEFTDEKGIPLWEITREGETIEI